MYTINVHTVSGNWVEAGTFNSFEAACAIIEATLMMFGDEFEEGDILLLNEDGEVLYIC